MNKKENSFLDELSEERRHNLTATREQLNEEREERIEEFRNRVPELSKGIEKAISGPIVREVMREVGSSKSQTIREWRQFEILAVEPVYYSLKFIWKNGKRHICKGNEYRWLDHERVVIRDVENGSRWVLIVNHDAEPDVGYGIGDYRSMIEASIFWAYLEYEYAYASDAIGDLIKLPTRNGQPDFPKVTAEAIKRTKKRWQEETDGGEVSK